MCIRFIGVAWKLFDALLSGTIIRVTPKTPKLSW
jgi:hypothetical protein